jgi:hypothetical protein
MLHEFRPTLRAEQITVRRPHNAEDQARRKTA